MIQNNNYINQVFHQQFNNSTSKQQYSFGKSSRFNYKDKPLNQSVSHLNNEQHSTFNNGKSTKFGTGINHEIAPLMDKSLIQKPHTYLNQSLQIKNNKQGISIGLGRSNVNFGSSLPVKVLKDLPAPNVYNLDSYNKVKKFKISNGFSMKKPVNKSLLKKQTLPGPGSYENNNYIDKKTGVSYNSLYKSTSSISFGKSTFSSFRQDKQVLPGPGQYKQDIQSFGRSTLSKIRSVSACKFGSSQRQFPISKDQLAFPGPTKYNQQSEFQSYGNRRLDQLQTQKFQYNDNFRKRVLTANK